MADKVVSIVPDELERVDAYRLMISVIVPRPIAWVSTVGADGTPNLAPYSFFNGVAYENSMNVASYRVESDEAGWSSGESGHAFAGDGDLDGGYFGNYASGIHGRIATDGSQSTAGNGSKVGRAAGSRF